MRLTNNGATLIELLAVVFIVITLTSIVWPIVDSAKKAATGTISVSNMHQIGLGLQLYSENYEPSNDFTLCTPPSLVTLVDIKYISLEILKTHAGHKHAVFTQFFPFLPVTDAKVAANWEVSVQHSGENPFVLMDASQDGDIYDTDPRLGQTFRAMAMRFDTSIVRKQGTKTQILDPLEWENL